MLVRIVVLLSFGVFVTEGYPQPSQSRKTSGADGNVLEQVVRQGLLGQNYNQFNNIDDIFKGVLAQIPLQNIYDSDVPSDTGLNTKQLAKKYGYPFENHTVQTHDGYILQVHRIPHGRNISASAQGRPPVLIMPGTACSSEIWVNMGPTKSLGFILADHGYDVWLLNYRGTRWSRKHVSLNPDKFRDKEKYWTFSFQQMGQYDIKAFVDYILKQTNQGSLFYIGHSQGTSSFFAFVSDWPDYNRRIRLAVLLGPVAYAYNVKSSLAPIFGAMFDAIDAYLKRTRRYEIMPYKDYQATMASLLCRDGAPTQDICAELYLLALGYTPAQLNRTMLPVMYSAIPAGASLRQFQHFIQLVQSKKFQKYDYGEKENLVRYGQVTAPEYNLGNVTAPVAFFYGDSDPLTTKEDVDKTASELPNLVYYRIIPGFSHGDVVWGIDVVKLIYNDVVSLMKKH